MRKEDCFQLGRVSKTFSYSGEVIIVIEYSDPDRFMKLESVFVEIHNKLVPFFIEQISFDRNGPFARVKFEDINDEAAARILVKKDLYLPLSLRPQTDDAEPTPEELTGYLVEDSNLGMLGNVVSFIDHISNPILEVDGEKGPILIPFHEELILEIDDKKQLILVEIPEGLIGLND